MPLGTQVGLGSGHIVFHGYTAFPRKGHSSFPLFGPYLLWPNRRPVLPTAELLLELHVVGLGITHSYYFTTILIPIKYRDCHSNVGKRE